IVFVQGLDHIETKSDHLFHLTQLPLTNKVELNATDLLVPDSFLTCNKHHTPLILTLLPFERIFVPFDTFPVYNSIAQSCNKLLQYLALLLKLYLKNAQLSQTLLIQSINLQS